MISIQQEIQESCDFLRRYLVGERGFSTGDVLAGIVRLRALHGQSASGIDRRVAAQLVRQSCEKLGRNDDHYKWACTS
jgi:hypothetical protein